MKKKYLSPQISKIKLDIKQALIAGCKKSTAPATGFGAQNCSKKCTSAIGT